MDRQNETLMQRAKNEMEKRFNRLVGLSSSNLCVRCGLCVDACHYVMSDEKDLAVSPVAKAERIRSVYKRDHDWLSKVFPWWTGAKKLTEGELEEWREVVFKNCSMCQRCTVNCPLGVDVPAVMGAARSTLSSLDMAISREENMDSFKESFVKGIKAMEKDLQEDSGDPEASIPLEVQGADFLYVPLSGAHTILPAAKIFNKANQSWTMSMFEASNYGIFLQDKERSKKIVDRVIKEAKRLGVKEVIITECGHAYTTYRWTAPSWYDEPWPFKVRRILKATGAENVVASCDNCMHQLGELSDFYKLVLC